MLDRRIAEAERGAFTLKIPSPRGLRLRLPGKLFHATPEVFFQEDGVTEFSLPQEAFSLKRGEAAIIQAGMPHGEERTGSFLNVVYIVRPEGFYFLIGYLDGWVRWGPLDKFEFATHHLIVRYTEELCVARDAAPGSPQVRGLYLALLARPRAALCDNVIEEREAHPLMRRCREMIDAHFTRQDFSVAWLARQLGCSPDHLSRLFHRLSGQRLIPSVHQKRIEYAHYLLRETDMNIAETAWACGFSQPSYYDRVFRAYAGVTPKQFREAQAKGLGAPIM